MDSTVGIEQPQASQTHVLGIDISKDTLSICLIDGTNRQTAQSPIDSVDAVENRRRGYRSVERRIRKHKVASQSGCAQRVLVRRRLYAARRYGSVPGPG